MNDKVIYTVLRVDRVTGQEMEYITVVGSQSLVCVINLLQPEEQFTHKVRIDDCL